MQATGTLLVAIATEFTARVERRHDDLKRGFAGGLGVWLDRDAATVIFDRERAIRADCDQDAVADASHRLVDAVVDHLGHQMMQPADVGAADIHAGALPHRLETFQNLDILRGVLRCFRYCRHSVSAALLDNVSCPRTTLPVPRNTSTYNST